MKIRNGFVSNSSSSSFVINKNFISNDQLIKIKNHIAESKKIDQAYEINWSEDEDFFLQPFNAENCDAWDITENEDEVMGFTIMDNFDMDRFLELIGIPQSIIHMRG